MRRIIAALLLTLAACSGDGVDGDTGAPTNDTGPLLYTCDCDPEWEDEDGYCLEGGFSFSCSGGNVTRCEDQCARLEDPCCAPYWRTE